MSRSQTVAGRNTASDIDWDRCIQRVAASVEAAVRALGDHQVSPSQNNPRLFDIHHAIRNDVDLDALPYGPVLIYGAEGKLLASDLDSDRVELACIAVRTLWDLANAARFKRVKPTHLLDRIGVSERRPRGQVCSVPLGVRRPRARGAKSTRARSRSSSRSGDSGDAPGDEDPEGSKPPGDPGRRFCAGCGDDITDRAPTAQTCSKKCGATVRQQRRRAKLKEQLPDASDYLITSASEHADLCNRTRCRCARPILDSAVGDCLKCGRIAAPSRVGDTSREVREAVYGNGTRSHSRHMAPRPWRTLGPVKSSRRSRLVTELAATLEPVDVLPELYSFAEHHARHCGLAAHDKMLGFMALPAWQQQQAWSTLRQDCDRTAVAA